jgi:hypothetical protein
MRFAEVWAIAVLGSGCSFIPSSECSKGEYRCNGNTLQVCAGFLGPALWEGLQACTSPQLCRTATEGADPLVRASGCFDPNAYCPRAGHRECGDNPAGTSRALFECTLQANDQTLRWKMTECGQLVPKHTCFDGSPTGGAAACLEVVENCSAQPAASTRCDGTDRLECTLRISDKAVWDWQRTSCAAAGRVCRVDPSGTAQCEPP